MSQVPLRSDPLVGPESSTGSSKLTNADSSGASNEDFNVDSILLVINDRLLEADYTDSVPKLRTIAIEFADMIKTLVSTMSIWVSPT